MSADKANRQHVLIALTEWEIQLLLRACDVQRQRIDSTLREENIKASEAAIWVAELYRVEQKLQARMESMSLRQ